jgi:SAM-dependent methyltransferase
MSEVIVTDRAAMYSSDFYSGQSGSSFESAMRVLPIVLDVVRPRSVIDVGCGVGTWLAAALQLGVERAIGFEGSWVSREDLKDSRIELVNHDLETPLPQHEPVDLAMSLEVAEHISAARASALVAEICRFAPVVLFGAAIPGQGGVNHINEQWQSYWADRFAQHGYRPLDLIRPKLWSDRSIEVHYRQNNLLYVHESQWESIAARVPNADVLPFPLDVAHPEVHMANYNAWQSPPTLSQSLRTMVGIPSAVVRSISVRLRRASATTPRGRA